MLLAQHGRYFSRQEKMERIYLPSGPRKNPLTGPITPREQEVINDLMLGHSNSEISIALRIEVDTVKTHLYRIFAKFGVENRGALILAESERLEKLKCQASAPAPDKRLTPRSINPRQILIVERLRKRRTLLRLRPYREAR